MGNKGNLIVISGPSGVGKGTICAALRQMDEKIKYSVSATTRQPRNGEEHGVHYFFLNEDSFKNKIEHGDFLEWACVYGNYYGTDRHVVERSLEAGDDIILEIDTAGALQVKEKMPSAVLIFIMPPDANELARRLYGRGTDAPDVIERRLACFEEEMVLSKRYDHIVVNNDLQQAIDEVYAIIAQSRI